MDSTMEAHVPLKLEPAEVYQEAALSLRYKRITAITAIKLERAMALLQLGPHHLFERGLATRRVPEEALNCHDTERRQQSPSASLAVSPAGNSVNRKKLDTLKLELDDGWGAYDLNHDSDCDSDSDCDEDDGDDDEEGPIYAFLVNGGVQLRPDEYVLLFRALGVSPHYIQRLGRSKSEAGRNSTKARGHHRATHLRGGEIGRTALPSHRPGSSDEKPLGVSCRGSNGRCEPRTKFTGENVDPSGGEGLKVCGRQVATYYTSPVVSEHHGCRMGVGGRGGRRKVGGTHGRRIEVPRTRAAGGGTWRIMGCGGWCEVSG
ncbi:unnamed protein product [Ascophyllum nodosum]